MWPGVRCGGNTLASGTKAWLGLSLLLAHSIALNNFPHFSGSHFIDLFEGAIWILLFMGLGLKHSSVTS
jgi:hypothetical protein